MVMNLNIIVGVLVRIAGNGIDSNFGLRGIGFDSELGLWEIWF